MSAVTMTFLGIGCLSLLMLVLSLIGGHLHADHLHVGHLHLGHLHFGHLHLGHLHLHAGHPQVGNAQSGDGGGLNLSLPVLAGFVGALGFGGAIAAEVIPGHNAWAATGVGLLAAIPTAWLAGRLVDAAMNMSTDATLTSNDLIGATGVVISEVPAGGYGLVRLNAGGQPLKFNARSAQPLPLGTRVLVIEVPTPTSVLVEPTPQFLVEKEAQ